MKRTATVVLVGRMNVGKSTLFNRLTDRVKSMVLDYAGVTRDVLHDSVTWAGKKFDLFDTGGLDFKSTQDPVRKKVQEKALKTVEQAALLLFVVDGTTGLVADDDLIVRHLRSIRIPFIVVVNKADVSGVLEDSAHAFQSCGGQAVVPISAEHGRGIEDLLDLILPYIPSTAGAAEKTPSYHVMLLGRPNVGKSSLMNCFLHQDRAIVSAQPGTTREAVTERIVFSQEHVLISDTPGLRRQSSVHEKIEEEMVHRSLQTLERADIILLVVDGTEGTVVDQELKLGFYAFTERYKALIVLFNKADITSDEQRAGIAHTLELYPQLTKRVPFLTISCVSGKNIGKIMPLVHEVWAHHSREIPQSELQPFLIQELQKKPLMRNGQRLALYYAVQVARAPITIALRVNEPAWFGPSQLSFLEKRIRAQYGGLSGAPIKFIVRKERID